MNKTKKHQKVQQPTITEEDKQNPDPFIRALAKKIRNINKKISDIDALAKRDDLKPEQQEKINSKQSIVDQRKKYEEFYKFYKATLNEVSKEEVNNQQNQILTKVSNAIIAANHLKTGVALGNIQLTANEKNVLSNISKVGSEEASFNELTKNLAGYLAVYLEDQKLVSKIEQVSGNGEISNPKNGHKKSEVEQIQNQVTKESSKQQNNTNKQQQQPVETSKPEVNQLKENPQDKQKDVVPIAINSITNTQNQQERITEEPKDEPKQHQEQNLDKNKVVEQKNQNKQQTQQKQVGEKKHYKNYEKPYYQNKLNYRDRQERNRQGGYRERNYNDGGYHSGGYKNNYRKGDQGGHYNKPRYQEKQDQDRDNNSDTSLDDSDQEEYRKKKFNNKEIRDLQNDGFHVIQKRPKPKDPRDTQNYSQKQHGYKDKKYHQQN